MRKNFKRLLGVLTAAALVITSICGINLINTSAETADSGKSVNLVSDDINNLVEFANPDSGHGPWDVPEDYQKIDNAANKVWYAWHNNSSGGGLIAVDDSQKYNNFNTLVYYGVKANDGALAYFYLKLEPGDYLFSFRYKGTNLNAASVKYNAKQSTLAESKDLTFNDSGKFNELAPQAEIFNKTKNFADGNTDWTEIKQNFSVAGNETQVVRFWFEPSGNADGIWFGNINVSAAEPEEDNEPTDPDELISKDVNKVKYFYNPDKGGESTADPGKTHMTGAEALNKNWYMWMREANNGNDISVVDEGHNGNPAIKLTGSENTALYGAGLAYFTLKLDPGTYELKYWAKCKDIYGNENPNVVCSAEIYSVDAGQLDKQWPVSVRLKKKTEISVFDSVPYYLEGTKYSEDWTQKTRTIKVTGDEAQLVDINFNTNNVAGEVWISDFSLKLKTSGGSSGDSSGALEDPEDPYYPTDSDDEPYYPDDSEITEDSDLETISKTGETSFIETAFILFVISAGFIAFEVTRRAKKANANGRH